MKGNNIVDIRILDTRLLEELPKYSTWGSAALDLRAVTHRTLFFEPGQVKRIPCGFAMHIEDSAYAGMILPRSGKGTDQGLVLANTVGLIDSDYQGEIKVPVWNRSDKPFVIEPMERIAQLVIVPILQIQWNLVSEFEESERGTGGFGSTGSV